MQYVIKLNDGILFGRQAYQVHLFLTEDGDTLVPYCSPAAESGERFFKELDEALDFVDAFKAEHPTDVIRYDDMRSMEKKSFKKISTGMFSEYVSQAGERRFKLHEGMYLLNGFDQPIPYQDVPGVEQPDLDDIYAMIEQQHFTH